MSNVNRMMLRCKFRINVDMLTIYRKVKVRPRFMHIFVQPFRPDFMLIVYETEKVKKKKALLVD